MQSPNPKPTLTLSHGSYVHTGHLCTYTWPEEGRSFMCKSPRSHQPSPPRLPFELLFRTLIYTPGPAVLMSVLPSMM